MSLSSFSPKTYDVFISFRGDDTRRNFTSHLYSALCQAGIKTYIDDDDLPKGDTVWPTLCHAIENSYIVAVVVFSENYATSKWCLKELIKILKCKKSDGQVVIPVFYGVDPSNIRKQTHSYEEALLKHEQVLLNNSDNDYVLKKMSKWKSALTEAANISGWDSRNRDYKNHFQVIKQIVQDVLQKLYMRYPPELKVEGLVGMDKVHAYFESLLSRKQPNQSLKNVKVIGIWGMGGIGKTTIVKTLFSQLFPQYDNVCFLANVREESKRFGLTTLSGKLLSDLLKDEIPKPNCIGSIFIAKMLNNKKVFIVLDDVDSLEQLDDLCDVYKYASPESILIFTTRDRHLLVGRVDEIYEAKMLSFNESLELFCLHAFKQSCPREGYQDLSKTAVDYAGGIPLALKVLGSNLYSRSTEVWDCELKKVKNYPHKDIDNVLRVSYDGLDIPQQNIFLDIAFFFKHEDKDIVEKILNASNFFATSGIKVLEDKALITISDDNKIQMHDLLQDMGLTRVEDPGKCTRLKNIQDICDVLTNKKGSDAVEGITLDLSLIDDVLHLGAFTFSMMNKLRILKLYTPWGKRSGKVNYPRAFDKISDNLRYLEWHGYRLKSLPSNFSAKMLVEIHMPDSHVTELWQGVQDVVNLEGINLNGCKHLKRLPDLSKASKLKEVHLTDCESLLAIHPSVLSLDTLETLFLEGCKKLNNLKSDKHLRSLKNVIANGCTGLKDFSISSENIELLYLMETRIEKLHLSLGNQTRLACLSIGGLRLRNLPNCRLSASLEVLSIDNCRVVMDKEKLHVLLEGLTLLRQLILKNCCKMSELPNNISNLLDLEWLILDGSSVEKLPESIKYLHKLDHLYLENCKKLQHLPELPPNLTQLKASNCCSLVTLSTSKFIGAVMPQSTPWVYYSYIDHYMWFENCKKLDNQCVMEVTMLKMMIILFHTKYGSNRYKVKVCLAGSKVPNQFKYRTKGSSLTITIPSKPFWASFSVWLFLHPRYGRSLELGSSVNVTCQMVQC